jgi:formate dehydrogenase major subunit
MGPRSWFESWPVYRQLAQRDGLGLGVAVKSKRSERLEPRVRTADKVAKSVCPYCAVAAVRTSTSRTGASRRSKGTRTRR